MASRLLTRRATWVVAGLAIGLLAGVLWRGAISEIPVQASATMGHDSFAIATGLVDERVEALYFLDFLTGQLRATVINPREAGFLAMFEYNISQDFNAAGGQSPRYLMVTGLADIPRGRGQSQIARSAVYITEVTTGQMCAYVIPWNSSLQASGKPQQGTFYKIGAMQLRQAFVRDQ